MTEKPRETQAELHVVELKEKVNNSSLMKHQRSGALDYRARLVPMAPARLQFRKAPYPVVPRAVRSNASA